MNKTFRGAALNQTNSNIHLNCLQAQGSAAERTLHNGIAHLSTLNCHVSFDYAALCMFAKLCGNDFIFQSKVCEVYNSLESPVFESSPSEQIMNFFPLPSSLSETSQVKLHHLLSLLLFVGAKKNIRSHLGSFARSFTFQARTFQQDSIHCSRARLHGKVHC